ncbi:MAG TPA: hypothetical protein PKC43_00475 [Phycisphaerales bacterium]|nr:hypothetical protein [Phycisphaerales bacterium]HMP35900.1 hypothetical protein [Phycisphaerales bacterium]
MSINDQGVAIGTIAILGTRIPCTWSVENGFTLIPKPTGAGGSRFVVGINNNGWMFVTWNFEFKTIAHVYKPNGSGGYEIFAIEPQGGTWSEALGINDLNQVVGYEGLGLGESPNLPDGGFFWSEETGKVQIQPPGWSASRCNDIGENGVIVGNVSQTAVAAGGGTTLRAFVLDGDELTIIEPPPPFVRSQAWSATATGLVGATMSGTGIGAGVIYDIRTGSLDVWYPPPGASSWGIRDLNDDGVAAGYLILEGTSDLLPAIAKDGVVVNLNTLLDAPYAAQQLLGIRNDGTVVGACSPSGCSLIAQPLGAPGDLDCDGTVGPADLALLLGLWGSDDSGADLNGDGVVGGDDLGILLGAWSCKP